MEKHKSRNSSCADSGLGSAESAVHSVVGGSGLRCCIVLMVVPFLVILYFLSSASRVTGGKESHIEEFSAMYFVCCFIGGILSGLPHTLMTPIDLVKCRMQVGEYESIGEGFKKIYAQAGGSLQTSLPHFFRGWVPTFFGYLVQGGLKFLFYEFFKFLLLNRRLDLHEKPSPMQQLMAYLVSSFMAELVAGIALAPWEAVKIKIQTTNIQHSHLGAVAHLMWSTEGCRGFYKGLTALWCRQVPYTVVKFVSFEKIANWLYLILGSTPRSATPKNVQLLISLLAGVLAGVLSAMVSHPADTVLSKLNQRTDILHSPRNSACRLLRELGWTGVWKGLLPRLLMAGSLTACQWLLYDSFKVFVGLPTTGGGSVAAVKIVKPLTVAPLVSV